MKKLRSHSSGRSPLSMTERSVIKLLHEEPNLLPGELAKREKVTSQSMSQILQHLDTLGYIVRQPQESDRRKVSISLSEAGQQFLDTTRHERDEWLSDAIHQTCSPDEQLLLRKALGPLNRLLAID
ncbi:MarR family winged helix-turn-helix transcriptional regulator [Spirosoma sp. KUDC1026]|uniref:MarR family winged helix-turn-helix transcriptional regulator n=1 Tax=Spirosoma sp. KUDC1026 TaxID=2745947 RepID=UPI00159BE73E|nr:MarR family transcriptional regulator [Spirosoma sp. KUDC1026]QKZ14709.1 MarR family transcriptional regulator [Spirosoma sp. KUDC1026]